MPPWLITTIIVTLVAFDLAIRIGCLLIVPKNRRPGSANVWLLTIFFLPFIGWFLFLVFGNSKLPKNRRYKQHLISHLIAGATDPAWIIQPDPAAPAWLGPLVRLNRNLGSMSLVGNNTINLYTDSRLAIDRMVEMISRAQKTVHVEFYVVSYDSFTEAFFRAMEMAVKRGITVRVLYDHIASLRTPGYYRMKAELKRIGVQRYPILPVQPFRGKYQRPDLRNHRKLLIVDGEVAFMGSQNLIDPSYNLRKRKRRNLRWRDTMLEIRGPVVRGINAVFISDWYGETDELLHDYDLRISAPALTAAEDVHCQVVPSGPGFEGENNLQMFLYLLHNAQKRIVITTPYFVPDEAMSLAVSSATARGIIVELFLSEISDQNMVYHAQCSYYESLLRAGVTIWLYKPPYLLHSKHMTIDDSVAVIGSSNFDMRSFNLNMEVSLLLHNRKIVAKLREIEETNRKNSKLLTLREWSKRSRLNGLKDNLARLTSSLQ